MMSSERMGSLPPQPSPPPPPPPLSPELCLATMRTVDMFDTSSWDSSLGLESALDRWSPLPSPPPGDTLTFWEASDGLQDIAAGSWEAHLGLEHCGVDMAFLHDTASNMSHSSSSSSTITSYSISGGLGDVGEVSLDEPGAWRDLVDAVALCSEPDIVVEAETQAAVCGAAQNTKQRAGKEQRSRTARHIKHTHHKIHKLPTASPHHPGNSSQVTSPAAAKHQLSSHSPHHQKAPSRDNILSPRKKKILTVLESNVKWSELSGSEQWTLGEGLNVLLSQSLGVREKLDVLSIIHPNTPGAISTTFNDLNLASLLDDDKLEAIRRYLKTLENNTELPSKFRCRKAGQPNRQHMRHNTPAKTNKMRSPTKGNHRHSATKGCNTAVPRSHRNHHSKRRSTSYTTAGHPNNAKKGNKKHKQGLKKLPQTNQRATKVYRQLLKEKRSGLFKEEEVVCLSESSAHSHEANNNHLHTNNGKWDEEDEDVDIIG